MKKSSLKKKTKKVKVIPFNKLPEWRQRVEIAKDVLKQLDMETYIAESGTYLTAKVKEFDIQNLHSTEIDKLVKENKITCKVCAKGALFMSHVMKTDNCTYEKATSMGDREMGRRLNMFSPSQLEEIEESFEGWFQTNEKSDVAKFIQRTKMKSDIERMTEIMKNIIKNKGTFKP